MKQTVRAARWMIVVGLVIGAVVGLAVDLNLDHRTVSATSQITLSNGAVGAESADAADTNNEYITNKMATYATLATSDDVLGPASAALGTSIDALRPEVTATPVGESTVLAVTVRGDTPADATAATDAVARTLGTAIGRIETPAGQPPLVTVAVTAAAEPTTRFVPPIGVLTALGAVLGGLLVVLGAVLWERGVVTRVGRLLRGFLRPDRQESPG